MDEFVAFLEVNEAVGVLLPDSQVPVLELDESVEFVATLED